MLHTKEASDLVLITVLEISSKLPWKVTKNHNKETDLIPVSKETRNTQRGIKLKQDMVNPKSCFKKSRNRYR